MSSAHDRGEPLLRASSGSGAEKEKAKTSLRLANVISIWNATEGEESTHRGASFFSQIELAKDGGFNDVRESKLIYSSQYIYAFISVLFIVMNTVYVNATDTRCVLYGQCGQHTAGASPEASCIKVRVQSCSDMDCINSAHAACRKDPFPPQPFMLGRLLLLDSLPADRLVACLEFFCLWFLILRVLRLTVMASCASLEVYRWVCITQIFWNTLPSLSCFSLMRLLYYVTPSVIGTEAYYAVTWTLERVAQDGEKTWSNCWPLARFILTRLLCIVIGFDAFLLKYRTASQVLGESPSISGVLAALLFLFQVLGVVNLNWFVKERLFLFIFGSENGEMTIEQKAREIVWNAMVARKLYQQLNWFKFLIVMLGFDDYDFQVLVMDPAQRKSQTRQGDRPVCPQGHQLKKGMTPFPRCDVCCQQLFPFTALWSCRRCNVDVCEGCKFQASCLQDASGGEVTALDRLEGWLVSVLIES